MKKPTDSMTDKCGVLPVIIGQFLILALKGDAKSLENFRKGYVLHFGQLPGADDLIEDTVSAGCAFVEILGSRFGWHPAATALLAGKVGDVCRAWIAGEDASPRIANLRTVDLWSGLVSCTSGTPSIPLSFLDCIVMTLLPVVCASEIRTVAELLAGFMQKEENSIRDLDEALGKCVARLCCGVEIPGTLERELKLVVLLHLPKDEGVLSANAGFAYKLLQRQFDNQRRLENAEVE